MRTYLVEVHGTLLQTLVNLMNDYSTNLLLYKDGYYQIDGDLHTKLPSKVFTNLHSALKSSRDDLKGEIELLNTTKDKISDLVSYEGSSHTSTVMNYNFLMNQLKNLDTSITQYESNHASQDLVAFKELLSATKALVAEHAGKTRTVGTYQSGDFAKLKSVQRFAIAYKQATQQMESRVERVQAAQERDKVRFEALARSDKGWKDMAVSALTIIVGVTAIVVTLGSATPLVVAGGIVGLGTTAYGASNMYEADQDIKLGNAGDIQTKAGNPIRDTLFMGNDKLYHDVGNVFVTASAIMIPIGQTQSVVKGLTQFAIGEAGAYTAGQVAYHGTKLLGGSEEDAQTANFIGNIVGGYAASSAASKFSLNKVKTQFSTEWNEYLNEFPKIEVDKNQVDEILRISPNPDDGVFRPNPRKYLPKEYRQAHKELFDNGVAAFVKDDFFIQKFGNFGREDGAFVFPKDVAKAMIKEADGNPRKLEALLGLDEGSLGDSPKLVLPQEVHNYRIPDGNEGGSRANPQWRPGGKTYPGGVPEAVIDPVPKDKVTLVDIWQTTKEMRMETIYLSQKDMLEICQDGDKYFLRYPTFNITMPEVVQEIPKEAADSYMSGEHTGKELMNYAQYGFWKSKKQYTQEESDKIFIRNNPDLIFNDLSDNQKIFSPEEFNQIVTQVIVSKLKPSELDSIGVVDSHLELLLVDPIGWEEEIEAVHLKILQEKINNYIHFLESKQYVERYGDNFDQKVIHITFQYSPSDNSLALLATVQKTLQNTDMSLKVELPE